MSTPGRNTPSGRSTRQTRSGRGSAAHTMGDNDTDVNPNLNDETDLVPNTPTTPTTRTTRSRRNNSIVANNSVNLGSGGGSVGPMGGSRMGTPNLYDDGDIRPQDTPQSWTPGGLGGGSATPYADHDDDGDMMMGDDDHGNNDNNNNNSGDDDDDDHDNGGKGGGRHGDDDDGVGDNDGEGDEPGEGDGYNDGAITGESDYTPQTPQHGDESNYMSDGQTPGSSGRLHDDDESYMGDDGEESVPQTGDSTPYGTGGITPGTPSMGDQSPGPGRQSKTKQPSASNSNSNQKKKQQQQKKSEPQPQGGAYTQRSGSRLRLGARPVIITYDVDDLDTPFDNYYECACFFNDQFYSVMIEGRRRFHELNETQQRIILEQQQLHSVPRPFCPETFSYDYSKHEYVYYIHFSRWDRRLDQWVTRDRLRCMEELVRYFQPYSFQAGATGKCPTRSNGYLVGRDIIELIQPRFPGMRYFPANLPSSPDCSQPALNPEAIRKLPPQEQHLPPSRIAEILIKQTQDGVDLGLTPAPGTINPTIVNGKAVMPELTPEQKQEVQMSTIFHSPVPPLPPPPAEMPSFLVPCLIPQPLPIVPVLPPDVQNQQSVMLKYNERYVESALATIQLLLNTALREPTAEHRLPVDNAGGDDGPGSAKRRGRVARKSTKDDGSATTTTITTTTTAPIDTDNWHQYPDGWYGPRIKVELPEDAILHYGPDTETEDHILSTQYQTSQRLVLGRFDLQPWYFSPYPDEYTKSGTLWMCEFCLEAFAYEEELQRHSRRCTIRHPPGQEIYRSAENNCEIAMFEVDGAMETRWCENLSYLAKLFLDHKTLYEDCSAFFYYVLCEITPRGYVLLGYYSRFKFTTTENLACILTLPQYQGRGYGKFLISFSYELSKIERRPGSPERPLSDLGRVSYIAYWTECAIKVISHIFSIRQQQPNGNILQYFNPEHIPGIYQDLPTFCQPLMNCTIPQIEKLKDINIGLISECTMVTTSELIEALTEKEVLQLSQHGQWCLNWKRIQQLLNSAAKKKAALEQRVAAMDHQQRSKHQSIRLAIPSLIRWKQYIEPPIQPDKEKKRNARDDDDDYDDEPSHHHGNNSNRRSSAAAANTGGRKSESNSGVSTRLRNR